MQELRRGWSVGKIRFGSPSAGVEMGDELLRLATQAIDEIIPGVRDYLADAIYQIRLNAQEEWPVRTGQSRASLSEVTQINSDSIQGIIEISGCDYTHYVRPKKLWGTTTAWQVWVKTPMKEANKEMLEDPELRDVIIDAMARTTR
jgi:hypothetical protein